ncbi:hypothetical protein CRN53_20435 [Vibrio vulnificus]|nr:hypothetical protein CRN53_20435 [Vibrio vulnificus]
MAVTLALHALFKFRLARLVQNITLIQKNARSQIVVCQSKARQEKLAGTLLGGEKLHRLAMFALLKVMAV